jgi:hemerythrin
VTRPRLQVDFDPLLETGNATIDAQHRELFSRIDRLLEAAQERRSAVEITGMLDFLGHYVVAHFSGEERAMAQSGYPGLDDHRSEHQQFIRDYSALYQEFKHGGPTLALVVRVSNRVTAWLREHIYRTDRTMAQWLKDHGQE